MGRGRPASLKRIDPQGSADNPQALSPAGTLHLTLTDYAKFVRLFRTEGGGVLAPDTVRKLTTPRGSADRSYALGWGTLRRPEWARGPALFHGGSNTFWNAAALLAPEQGLAALAVSNDGAAAGEKAVTALAESLMRAGSSAGADARA